MAKRSVIYLRVCVYAQTRFLRSTMKLEEKTLRIGAAILLTAVILRIFAPVDLTYLFSRDGFVSVMLFMGTGRWVESPQTPPSIPTLPMEEDQPEAQAVFSLQELNALSLHNPQSLSVDMQAALLAPLKWQLADGEPAVLIVHSHASEAYANCSGWRSEDAARNMISVGNRLTDLLEDAGIGVIHDRSIHDLPSYDAAYESSRAAIQNYLSQYPSIRLVLDLHRDAAEDGRGNQVAYTANYNGQDAATMMLVVSAYDYKAGGTTWQRNLAFATKLQLQLEQLCPGSCRPLALRLFDFSQDISPTGVLIEMGFAGNEQEEALHAAQLLADAIIALQNGSEVITAVSSS